MTKSVIQIVSVFLAILLLLGVMAPIAMAENEMPSEVPAPMEEVADEPAPTEEPGDTPAEPTPSLQPTDNPTNPTEPSQDPADTQFSEEDKDKGKDKHESSVIVSGEDKEEPVIEETNSGKNMIGWKNDLTYEQYIAYLESLNIHLPDSSYLDQAFALTFRSIAAIATKELYSPDNREYPNYSDCVKYNTWAYEREVINPFSGGNYIQKYDWNAAFVSWVADQSGLVMRDIFPKTADANEIYQVLKQYGIDHYYKEDLGMTEGTYTPQPDDLIFFPTHDSYKIGIVTTSYSRTVTYIMGDVDGKVAKTVRRFSELPENAFVVHWMTEEDELRPYLDFLQKEIGLTRTAAIGVMANIYGESRFNAHAIGDGGTSYGYCQWHNGRWLALMDLCNALGLDWTSPEGQMEFLKQEMLEYYRPLIAELNMLPLTEDGVREAAYRFCEVFERPADVAGAGSRRGDYAVNTLLPLFGMGGGEKRDSIS